MSNPSYFPPEWRDPAEPGLSTSDAQYVPPWQPLPRPSLRETVGTPLLAFAGTTVALVLLGAPLALLWRALAPTAKVLHTASGPVPAAPESSQVFSTDAWFALTSLLAGLVLGVVAWFALRDRGTAGPFGLAAGGLLAAYVAVAVGRRLVVDRYVYDFCGDLKCIVYDGTLHLHATAAVVVFPVALLVAFVAMTFFFEREV